MTNGKLRQNTVLKIITFLLILSFSSYNIVFSSDLTNTQTATLQVPIGDNPIVEVLGTQHVKQIDREIATFISAYLKDSTQPLSDINALLDKIYDSTPSGDGRLLNLVSVSTRPDGLTEMVLMELASGNRHKFKVIINCDKWSKIVDGTGEYKVEVLPTEEDYFKIVNDHIAQGVIPDENQKKIAELLLELGQGHLFRKWDKPGINDDKKRAFLEKFVKMDEKYPGGLRAYQNNGRKLLEEAASDKIPYAGTFLNPPQRKELINMDELERAKFFDLTRSGLENADTTAIVLVAGGTGKRLGYSGIPLDLTFDLVTGMNYLDVCVANITAMQEESGRIKNKDVKIPLVIMTSDDTDAATRKLLKDKKYDAIRHQITVLKQESVPLLSDNEGDFASDKNDPYSVQAATRGHGNVHILLNKSGLVKTWAEQGKTHTVFIQDNNAQVFNFLPVALAMADDNGCRMNFMTVPREPKEDMGAVVDLVSGKSKIDVTCSIEYDLLDDLLKTSNLPGDVAEDETGYSPYPGNTNVLILRNDAYSYVLEETNGIVAESIHPEYDKGSKTAFKPLTTSARMQDVSKEINSADVGVLYFDEKPYVFSPARNSLEIAAKKNKEGNYPDALSTSENDYYGYFRKILFHTGVKINVLGEERFVRGVPFRDGAKVVLDPKFVFNHKLSRKLLGTDTKSVKSNIEGGEISARSTLVIQGRDIYLKNLNLDGSLVIRVVDGAKLTVNGLKVKNFKTAGQELVELTDTEMQDPTVPDFLKVRGYKLVECGKPLLIEITEPGEWVVEADGSINEVKTTQSEEERILSDDDLRDMLRFVPRQVRENVKAGVIKEQRHLYAINLLLKLKQRRLFDKWDAPGTNDERKRAFLDQVLVMHKNYPGGLEKYQAKAIRFLVDEANGVNPFAGYTPEVVADAIDFSNTDDPKKKDEFYEMERLGVNAGKDGVNASQDLAVVLVAGGLGERLGYSGIKIGIKFEQAMNMTYLEWYLQNIKALQEESGRAYKTPDAKIPLVIMTSEDNHQKTEKLLEELLKKNEYSGLKDQITLVEQGLVPALNDTGGNFVLGNGVVEKNQFEQENLDFEAISKKLIGEGYLTNKLFVEKKFNGLTDGFKRDLRGYDLDQIEKISNILEKSQDAGHKLLGKPHGHGDVHMLLHQQKIVRRWNLEKRKYSVFIQDTNAQLFNAVRAGLGVSFKYGYDMNFLTTSRDAGEKSGSVVKLVSEEHEMTCNVEYNQLPALLKATRYPEIRGALKELNRENERITKVNNLQAMEEAVRELELAVKKENNKEIAVALEPVINAADEVRMAFPFRHDVENATIKKAVAGLNDAIAEAEKRITAIAPGDVPDQKTGQSPYYANLNAFILKNDKYEEALNKTDGLVPEFINPKYKDSTRTTFESPVRVESMMQDIAKLLSGGSKVGVTNFPKQDVFSPAKNDIVSAAMKHKDGNYPDGIMTSETDLYRYSRWLLKNAGVGINVKGTRKDLIIECPNYPKEGMTTLRPIPYYDGVKALLYPDFATTAKDVMKKIDGKNVKIADNTRSALVIKGKNIYINSLDLDGALTIEIADNVKADKVKLTIDGLKVGNDGWEFKELTLFEMRDKINTPEELRMRGYRLVIKDQKVIKITEPGEYVVGKDGVLRKIEPEKVEKDLDKKEEQHIKAVHRESQALFSKIKEIVKNAELRDEQKKINIVPNLSLMSKEHLSDNIEVWAEIILLCKDLKNVNFIFEDVSKDAFSSEADSKLDHAPLMGEVLRVLEEKLKENAAFCSGAVDVDDIVKNRIRNVRKIQGESKDLPIEIPIIPQYLAESMRDKQVKLGGNEYPVVMENPVDDDGIERFMNFEAATVVALAKASLILAQAGDRAEFDKIKSEVRDKLNGLYRALGKDTYAFSVKTLENMIDRSSVQRLGRAIDTMLPGMPVQNIEKLKFIKVLLRAA